MNKREYREEKDKAQARATIESVVGAIILFGGTVFLHHNGMLMRYALGLSFLGVCAWVWFIERTIR